MQEQDRIIKINIEEEMKKSYIDNWEIHQTNLTKKPQESSAKYWVNTIRTAIHPYTEPWCVWRRIGLCDIRW